MGRSEYGRLSDCSYAKLHGARAGNEERSQRFRVSMMSFASICIWSRRLQLKFGCGSEEDEKYL